MLYQIKNGTKFYGATDVFENILFEVQEQQKIAVVGRNGCGKSTLLKIMMNQETLSAGTIHVINNIRIGYLAQSTFEDESITVEQELLRVFEEVLMLKEQLDKLALKMQENQEDLLEQYSILQNKFECLGGYTYHNELLQVFTKFGFEVDDLKRQLASFSGGQKTRIAFVKLLLSKPDILLLDEPTNHLDLKTIEWLEGYLKKYPKAIVLVSHDRVFLDQIAQVVYEIEYGVMRKYVGNYTKYQELKKLEREKNVKEYQRQQKEIERLNQLIERFRYKASKASFAQSKIKYLEKMDKVELLKESDTKSFKAQFRCKHKGGQNVLMMEDLVIGYDKPLCKLTLDVHRQDAICILGDNGTGKSTLVKTLMGLLPKISGHYLFGHQIEIGYFDQQLAQFDSNKTVLEELWDAYPDLTHTQVRNVLGQFLFTADDVFKHVQVLSGGEKVRLYFAKLMLQQPNLLILDEPTNHLDIVGKEALEEALKNYDGTILFVSHDRYFIRQIAKSCLVLDGKQAIYYSNGYMDYMEKQEAKKEEIKIANKPKVKQSSINTQIRKVEARIDELEKAIALKRELRFEEEYYHDYQKMNQLNEEIDELNNEIARAMLLWEELSNM